MTTRGARQLLKDLYNKSKTQEIMVILIGNAWEEGAAMGVMLELLLINTVFLDRTGQHAHPLNPELIAVKTIRPNIKRDARNANNQHHFSKHCRGN